MDLEEKLYYEKIKLASLPKRFFAFWIDELILSCVFVLIYWESLVPHFENYYAIVGIVSTLIWQRFFLGLIYESVFLVLYGATLGKMLLKIRVVSVSLLDTPNVLYALIRALVKVLSQNLLYLPYLFVFFSTCRQALHDLLGKTIVVDYA